MGGRGGGGGGVLPKVNNAARLCPKGLPSSGCRYMKRYCRYVIYSFSCKVNMKWVTFSVKNCS